MKRAAFFEQHGGDQLTCNLCPIHCTIPPNGRGRCGVRLNREGELILETWGRVAYKEAVTPDALPLYHANPWIRWLVLGQRGCNMRCPFCNTSRYSLQGSVAQETLSPDEAVALAFSRQCSGISFGINEPVIAIEYVMDVFDRARASGYRTHIATNGYIEEEPLRELARRLDFITIGIKSLDQEFHDRLTGGNILAIIHTAHLAAALGVHVEFTYIVERGRTDGAEHAVVLDQILAEFGPRVAVILLPFEPAFTWSDRPASDARDLEIFRARFARLRPRVYSQHRESIHRDTRCPNCSRTLVRRSSTGYLVTDGDHLNCPGCGGPLPFAGL